MADNIAITAGSGTTIATDDVGGVHYQVVKVAAGADDSATLVSTTNPLPVINGMQTALTFRTRFTLPSTDVALVSVSAGSRIVLTRLSVALDNASTVFPSVLIGFGTATTPTTTAIFDHPGVPAGGGASIGSGAGILAVGADGADLRVTTVGTATGNGIAISGSYYILTP